MANQLQVKTTNQNKDGETAVQDVQSKTIDKNTANGKKAKKGEKEAKKDNGQKKWWIKDIVLASVNFLFLAGILILLGMLPAKGKEFKQLRNRYEIASAKSEVEIAEFEIQDSSQKADELIAIYPKQSGLADFAGQMDLLRGEGLITNFSFASEKAVRDRTGYYGVPLVIRLSGTWDQISQGLSRIEELPFLLRAVNVEAVLTPDGNLVDYKYGGFLYVDESLAETR